MPYVGYSSVANQANTSDGFAERTSAKNNPADTLYGDDVGDGGVVDLYHNATPPTVSYILMESSGYVLQETSSKIQLEVG
jgi:hypothetical protein